MPDSSSYMELPGSHSRQSSSPVESAVGDLQIQSSSWLLGNGPEGGADAVIHDDPIFGFDMGVSAHSDTHPDVAASLVAEYLTDTILRIDSGAIVDVSVMVKQDLLLIAGEVGCSHPAKSAIVHSDQFLGTLNGSIRDILKDIGFTSSPQPPISTLPPVAHNSPLRKPSSPKIESRSDEDGSIDPASVHVIIALSDGVRTSNPNGVVCEASASNHDFTPIARKICLEITTFLKSAVPGGVSVDIHPYANGDISSISVSYFCPKLDNELVKELSDKCLSNDFLKSLSPHIRDDTVVTFHHTTRNRSTGQSYRFTGKGWDDPRRYGHVLARQEAMYLVKSGLCSKCEVKIRFVDRLSVDSDIGITNLSVNSFGSSRESDSALAKKVLARCSAKTIKELQESIMLETTSSFFALDHGGSMCSDECVPA